MPNDAASPSRLTVPNDGTISLRDLLQLFKDRDVTEDTITWLRTSYFIHRPEVRSLGDEAGTTSSYRMAVVDVVERYLQLREASRRGELPRNKDDWLWRMWFEKLPVDMRGWGLDRLDAAQKLVEQINPETVSEVLADGESLPKNTIMRAMRSRARKVDERVEGFRWALAVARGEIAEVSLYDRDIEPSPLEFVLKVGGLSVRLPPPDLDFHIEESSIARLREVIDDATEADMERARDDLAKFESSLATIPLAGLNRHARRSLGGRHTLITQDTIAFLRELWHRYDARAAFLAKSIERTRPVPPRRGCIHDREGN